MPCLPKSAGEDKSLDGRRNIFVSGQAVEKSEDCGNWFEKQVVIIEGLGTSVWPAKAKE
jgi:hypothetical protein